MRHVIIGGGVASITAAIELARRQAGEIELYTAERYPYYFRPRLPYFLAGEIAQEDLYVHPLSWYENKGIAVHLDSKVERLMPDQKRVLLANGSEVPYDRLLLATGGVSFIPPIEGTDKKGVFALRTLDDAITIREYAAHCQEAVVIGGGLLGLEAARGLRALGLSVTALEFFPRLLPRQLDAEGSAVFQRLIEGLGINVGLQAETKSIVGKGEVRGVVLKDGREFAAQMVLVAAGARSNAGLAAEAGLRIDRGIAVDEHMATDAPDIYAAGDAAFRGRAWGIIPVARAQALVAAANMAGDNALYEEVVPSNTLKIVGIDLTSAGTVTPEDEGFVEIRRSDPEAGVYKKLVLKDNTLVGAIVLGDKALARKVERMVTSKAQLSREEAEALL
ncbi:MAG: NAD(P)/FAD-dependent oxidoreductase [Anaerolineae bacterium]|nr:NAD(P)/FAD-dependent oxidoreductase [Anaerolineae bacterium]